MDDKITTQSASSSALDTIDDLIADAGRGTEAIGANDVRPPRLKLCQSGSPERKPDNPKQIAGLNELDLFNSLSGDIYGRSIDFCVIAALGTHWIEFADDLSIVDANVKEGDPRTEWTVDDGQRVKPIATKFHDYLLFLPNTGEVVVFSFKSTQIKVAIKLNGLLKLPLKIGAKILANPPAWARLYKLDTKMVQDGTYAWGGFNLSTLGVTAPDVRQVISQLAQSYSKATIIVERDETDASDATLEDVQPVGAGDPSDM